MELLNREWIQSNLGEKCTNRYTKGDHSDGHKKDIRDILILFQR